MHPCILTPLDGTAFGEHALPHAAALARRSGATLHLAHVHELVIAPSGAETVILPPSWTDLTRAAEQSYLDEVAQRLASSHGIQVRTHLTDGEVADALERCTLECGATLVVMSTHAHTGLSRLWHHGVAERMTRDLPMPVLLVRAPADEPAPALDAEPEIEHVLIPLDGTPYAEAMIEHAVALGRVSGARYTLLRVVRPESAFGSALLGQDRHSYDELYRERTLAQQYLNALAERMRAAQLDVRTRVVVSSEVAAAILEQIAGGPRGAGRADLLAIQAHPHRPVSRVLAPHITDTLLRGSPVPVLLFQPTLVPQAPAAQVPAPVPI